MEKGKIRSLAKEEMAREKARILRIEKRQLPHLEKAASEWERKQAEKRAEQEKTTIQKKGEIPIISLGQISAPPSTKDNKADDTIQWRQYRPPKKEELKPGRVNEAGIWVSAKGLIAREWARALGRKREDPRVHILEQEAAKWKEKKEKEEQEKRENQRLKEMLERALQAFGEKLLEAKDHATAEFGGKLFKEALEEHGKIIEVQWQENGCNVLIEPWGQPFIYKAGIDQNLEVACYEKITTKIKKPKKHGTKIISGTELEVVKVVEDKGGQTSILAVAREIGLSSNYARILCTSLGRADYLDVFASGKVKITPKGKMALK